jgi:hypothetical protein
MRNSMTAFDSSHGHRPLDPRTAGAIVDALLECDTVSFHGRQTDLLRHYRRREADQEPLSVALVTRLRSRCPEERRRRLEETWHLLEHVHDPLIG